MSFDPSKYRNQSHLKHSGKSVSKRLQLPFKKATNKLNEITDKLDGNFESDAINFDEFIPRFWENNSSKETLIKEFESRRDKKYLLKGLNKLVNGKIILRDYKPINNVLLLLHPNDQSIKIITGIYLQNLELIQGSTSLKAFQDYFRKYLIPSNFSTKRVQLIYDSKDFLTSYDGIKLFVERKLKNLKNLDDSLRSCGFITANTDFKRLTSYQYLYECFRKGQVEKFQAFYEELLNAKNMNKRVIPLLVLLAKESGNSSLKKIAEEKSSEYIGNPLTKIKWTAPDYLKKEEEKRLEKARVILSEWFIKSFIGVFFKQLAKDPARKKYWLTNIKFIEDIRVYGNQIELNKFLNFFKSQYGVKKLNIIRERLNYYSGMDKTCGIVMNIRNYEIVEFTDTGALYCYLNKKNRIKRRVESSKDLKHPEMPLAINAEYIIYQEGRVMHSGSWERRFDYWLKKHIY